MYATETKDPALMQPADNDVLWRYQTLDKFQSLIKEESLFFCRLDKLRDPREGTLPSTTVDTINEFLTVTNKDERIQFFNEAARALTAVNCWHMGEDENALMWSAYAKHGVAIKTSFASLKGSMRLSRPTVYGGIVQYIDHQIYGHVHLKPTGQHMQWSLFQMATLKSQPFEGEKEFRLIANLLDTVIDGKTGKVIEPKRTDNGIFVNVNLYWLLHEVIVSPEADSALESKVKALVEPINERLPGNRRIPVAKSTLYG